MTPEQFYDKVKEFGIELTEEQKWQLHRYYELLVEWNEKMNLTGITEVNEVYLKHFYDFQHHFLEQFLYLLTVWFFQGALYFVQQVHQS